MAERKAKIDLQNKELENKSVFEYRKAVKRSLKATEAFTDPKVAWKGSGMVRD